MSTGWNIMGYPCGFSQDALSVVQSLITDDVLGTVIDEKGTRILNFMGTWINQIGDFMPGEGYYVKLNQSHNIIISDENMAKAESRVSAPETGGHCVPSYSGNPYMPMQMVVTNATIESESLEIGDEIGLFDGGICVGSSKITGQIEPGRFWITASKDDGTENGFTDNHTITVKIYDASENKEYDEIEITWVNHNNEPTDEPLFEGLGTVFAEVNAMNIPEKFGLSQNYPNPFNPTTVISYQLPVNSDVQLQIYNIRGQLVKTLIDREIEAGYHQIHWNGQNEIGRPVASGVYFYILSTPTFTEVKKMVLLR